MAAATIVEVSSPTTWGRKTTAAWTNTFGALALVVGVPSLLHMNWIALEQFDGSLTAAGMAAFQEGPIQFAFRHFPQFSWPATIGYAGWLLFQAALYGFLPGTLCYGQRTPGGHLLQYTANGLFAWSLTHGLYIVGSVLGWVDPAIVAKHWEGLLVAVNVYGFLLSIMAQLKGYYFPSYPEDCKLSGKFRIIDTIFDHT